VAVFNFAISIFTIRFVHERLERAESRQGGFRYYADSFDLICGQSFRSPLLGHVREVLGCGGSAADVPASVYTRRHFRLAGMVIEASSILYFPIQSVTLWDIQLLGALERWQRVAGKRARGWLRALGEVEALSALARLSHDNPGWTCPQVDQGAGEFEAASLGHPLLREGKRVDNDVTVGPPGTFLLVTGSNMSGKSTLLRAIGINAVLAGAGGPACARSLRLPPVDLWTSMRVEDSLEQGVSYYMAELQRLKRVVDAARLDSTRDGEGRRLLYLLDEILQGTNTFERQIAARRVILYLVRQGAIGAVSTHDLTLADEPAVAAVAQPVHFTETLSDGIGGPAMSFDYKLRPGIATSTNALRLLQIVGIDLGDESPQAPPGNGRDGARASPGALPG
jgi:DNA mismatch repair ATPase MutS